jgi:hypothetical protein
MTQSQQIGQWPWFGTSYVTCGLLWMAYVSLRFAPNVRKLFLPLGGLMIGMGALSGFVEQWSNLKDVPFKPVALFILIIFFWPYRALCVQMIRAQGIDRSSMVERFSFLPLIYILLFSVWLLTPKFLEEELPPLELYVWIVLVCVLHVPMFGLGKSAAIKFLEQTSFPENSREKFSAGVWGNAAVSLCVPLLITFIVQCKMGDDWRLFGINAVMTVVLLSLLLISCRLPSEWKLSNSSP